MEKRTLKALGIEIVEDEATYENTLKEIFDDVFGVWASSVWSNRVEKRDVAMYDSKFLNGVFGNYDLMGYTVIVTDNRKVAFLNRANYFMDGSDSGNSVKAIVALYESKDLKDEYSDKFELIANI